MEDYSSEDYEDEVDEDLEAMLYSQVHHENINTVDQMSAAYHSADGEPQHVFTVTPMKTIHSSVSLKDSAAGIALAVKQQSQLFESVPFDSEDPVEARGDGAPVVDFQKGSALEKDSPLQSQTPDMIYLGTSSDGKGSSGHTCLRETKFDIEAELGMCVLSSQTKKGSITQWEKEKQVLSSQTKKGKKTDSDSNTPVQDLSSKSKKYNTKHDRDTPVQAFLKSSTPKCPRTGATHVTPDFIKIGDQASQTEKDYRKTLNQLLISHTSSKKVRDIVVIKSDSASSGSVSDSDSTSSRSVNEPADCDSESESSSVSTSGSDVEVLGSPPAGQSMEPPLDLNWNVTTADRQTIERVEKRSSQVEEAKWKISDADLAPVTRPQVSRYYAKKEIRCRNCDKQGHLSKVCPVEKKKPVCTLCGTEGHVRNRCPGSLCFNCDQPGHRGNNCSRPKRGRFTLCGRCQGRGHAEDQCPDLWRQYHLTVTSVNDLTPRRKEVNRRIFCCNCAKEGHFAHECRQDRMDKYTSPLSPFIIKYDVLASVGKGTSGTRSAGRERQHPHKSKRFKSSHCHSHTPQRSQDDQALYPRGSGRSVPRNETQTHRYFDRQPSARSTPNWQQTPSLSSTSISQGKDGQKAYSPVTAPSVQGRTQGRPYLSAYTKRFMQRVVQEGPGGKTDPKRKWSDPDKHFDWQGEDSSAHPSANSRKRRSSPIRGNEGGAADRPTPPKKRKGKSAKDRPWTNKFQTSAEDGRHQRKGNNQPHKQHQKTTRGRGSYSLHVPQRTTRDDQSYIRNISEPLDQGKAKKRTHEKQERGQGQRNSKPSFPQPSTSTKGLESLTVTCRGGFRTTVKTMNLNRNSRNAQC